MTMKSVGGAVAAFAIIGMLGPLGGQAIAGKAPRTKIVPVTVTGTVKATLDDKGRVTSAAIVDPDGDERVLKIDARVKKMVKAHEGALVEVVIRERARKKSATATPKTFTLVSFKAVKAPEPDPEEDPDPGDDGDDF